MSREVSFAYIKSEGVATTCEYDIYREFAERDITIIKVEDIFMSYIKLRKHQPILFDIRGELNDIWKIQGAARLIGTTVRTLLVEGNDAIKQTFDTKLCIRRKYALPCEFGFDLISRGEFFKADDDGPCAAGACP